MKRNMMLLSSILALLVLASCAIDPWEDVESGDQYHPYEYNANSPGPGMTENSTFSYFVRVEKADGTNFFLRPDDYYLTSLPAEGATVCIIRERDQAQMTLDYDFISKMNGGIYHGYLIPVAWNDMDLRSTKNRPDTYDDAYTAKLDVYYPCFHEQHEVRINIHVEGKWHKVTRREVDGQKVTPEIIDNGFPMFRVTVGNNGNE